VPAFRAKDDPELATALTALADLLRRHGGRDDEVRAAFDDAFAVATRRRDWDALNALVRDWTAHLAALRDTGAQVALMMRCLDVPCPWQPLPIESLAARVAVGAGVEPLIAQELAERARVALRAIGEQAAGDAVLMALVEGLESAGRAGVAAAVLDAAWLEGCTAPRVLDRLSGRLESDAYYAQAVEVCARALSARGRGGDAATLAAIKRRYRRCQGRLAARLFD
jgi:hypothetical protein